MLARDQAPERRWQVIQDELTHEEQVNAIKTWRYLRVAMVVLVIGLGISILVERSKVDCWQTSISAYYYTPVHGYLVGALVAIGACLFCLKGSTSAEDVFLNLAGMFAPVVALVPTPNTGGCASVLGSTDQRDDFITNNVTTLLWVGGIGLALLAALSARDVFKDGARPGPLDAVGYAVALAALVAVGVTYGAARTWFTHWAHGIAAGAMFLCIIGAVVVNARTAEAPRDRPAPRPLYTAIAGLMIVAVAATVLVWRTGWWDYWALGAEVVLIGLFAAFWVVQTWDLWHEGLR